MMTTKPLQLLILEDQPADAALVTFELEQSGFEFEWERVYSEADYLATLRPDLDLILSDYTMPQFNALQALELLQAQKFDIPFIVVTGTTTEETAVECMRRGADDYLLKDRLARLGEAVKTALKRKRLRQEREQAQQDFHESVKRFLALFEYSPIGMAMIDANDHFLQINHAFEEMFNYRRKELKDLAFSQLTHPYDRTKNEHLCQKLASQPANQLKQEVRYIQRDGQVLWGRTTIFSLQNEHETPNYAVVMVEDVTQQKQAEIKLTAYAYQQQVVADLGHHALLGKDLAELMDGVVTILAQTLEVDYSKILELTPDGESLVLRAGVGWPEGTIGQATVSAGLNSQAGYTLQTDEPVIVEDLRVEKRFNSSMVAFGQDVVSSMSVIIRGKARPFGTLSVYTKEQRIFSQDEVNFLQSVANVLATAIERKRAEEAIKERELFNQGVLDSLPAHIAVLDREGYIIAVNEAWMDFGRDNGLTDPMFGVGTNYLDVCQDVNDEFAVDAQMALAGIQAVLDGIQAGFSFEYPCHSPQEVHWFMMFVVPLADLEGVVISHIDITELKKAQEALKEGEAHYRGIVEDQTELICRWVPDRTLVFVNDAYCHYFGRSRDALIGHSFMSNVSSIDQDDVEQTLSALSEDNPIVMIECRVIVSTGETRWQSWTNRAIFSEQDDLLFIQSVGRDITERKMVEESLRESETRYRTLFDIVPAAIYTKDLDGYYTSVNPNTQTYWADGPLGYRDIDLLPADIAADLRAADLRVMESGEEIDIEERFQTPNGLRIVLSNKVPLWDRQNNIAGILGVSVDITERKQMEESLRVSQERYQTLAALLPVGIFHTDAQGRHISYANQRLKEIVDFEKMETVADLWADSIDWDRIMLAWRACVAAQENFTAEYRLLRQDGREIWTLVQAVPEWNDNCELVGYIGTVSDITERKDAEEKMIQLYEAEQKRYQEAEALRKAVLALVSALNLRQVIEQILTQLQNVVPFDSSSVQLLQGNTLEIIGGQGFDNLSEVLGYQFQVSPETPNASVLERLEPLIIDDVLDSKYKADFQKEPLGVTYIRSWMGIPLYIGQRAIGMLTIDKHQSDFYTDDHARAALAYAAQAAIALENARLHEERARRVEQLAVLHELDHAISVSESIEDVYQAFARDTGRLLAYDCMCVTLFQEDDLKIVFSTGKNKPGIETRQTLGASASSWVVTQGQPLLRHDIGADLRFDDDETLVSAGILSAMILPLRYKRRVMGTWNIGHHQINAYDADDLAMAQAMADQLGIAIQNAQLYKQAEQEIADRRQTQEELEQERASLARRVRERTAELSRAYAELSRASRLKDEFLASMSHELRTPLNAILGMAEVLQEEVYGGLTSKQLRSVNTIRDSGSHLLDLINDILDLSKIGAGKLQLEFSQVPVRRVCQASLQFIKQTAHKKQIKVSASYDDVVESFWADERRLKQILVNLLSNAVKFTPEGGTVQLEILSDETNEVIHFIIEDSGIGIRKEYMDRLFQPFVQLDSRLSRQYAGTGLGLSLVYRLTEMHGGSISVESEVDQGSRFTVSLPWQQVEERQDRPGEVPGQESKEEPPSPILPKSAPLILLVEDNQANVEMLSEYLLSKGYDITVAHDGQEGIKRAEETRPNLILMDVQMPQMDGVEAMSIIRSNEVLADIPIIAVTALAMPGDQERCLTAGASEYLSKPLSLKRLTTLIERHLA